MISSFWLQKCAVRNKIKKLAKCPFLHSLPDAIGNVRSLSGLYRGTVGPHKRFYF